MVSMYTDTKPSAPDTPVKAEIYYPDDKIVFVSDRPVPEAVRQQDRQHHQQQSMAMTPVSVAHDTRGLPAYTEPLPKREIVRRPFLKRHMLWLIAALLLIIAIAGVIAGVLASRWPGKKSSAVPKAVAVANNTIGSVASSGLWLNGGKTWNMQMFWQNTNGNLWYRMSLDGVSFQQPRNASLRVPPRTGSPLSATAVTDPTGVVYLSMFYIAVTQQIAICVMACASGASSCSTISNNILETSIPISNFTGLAGVTVSNAQDWRVYYHDKDGLLSQLQGNASGFDRGEIIGGVGLNNTAIAAINVNSTKNNIVLFYSDARTSALYSQQFVNGAWTLGVPLSTETIQNWNPTSGLGVAYSETPDQLHVYYTGLDTLVYEFLGSSASKTVNTTWGAQPMTQKAWAAADYVGADIAAIGWKDQVRTFQKGRGSIVESLLSNTTWTQKFAG